MEIAQLRMFMKVAETENMTRAAQELQVAQPSISKTVRQLEDELGHTLFDRVGKYIYLNENGRILLKHARTILQELESAKTEIFEANNRRENEVILYMQAASKLLPELISAFRIRHPDIKLGIIQEDHRYNAKWDVCITSTRFSKPSPNSRSLLKESILLAVPRSHPLVAKEHVRLESVANESFIALHKGKALRQITDEYCRMAGFEPNIEIESDNPNVIRELLSLGIGVAMIPEITWDAKDYEKDGNIKKLYISSPLCKRYINIITPERSYKPQAVQIFEDFLVEFFLKLQAERQ